MPGKIRPLSSQELGVIAKELGILEGSHFKSFYELREGSFLITFSKERRETAVYVNLASTVNITEFKERDTKPTEFALSLRKRLDGSRVEGVEQHGSDRILVIGFGGKEEKRLIIEMFGRGNLLLLDKDGVIEQVYAGRDFSERSVKRGALYAFPQQRGRPAPGSKSERLAEVGGRYQTLSALLDSEYMQERSSEENPEKARELEELGASVEKLKRQIDEMREKGKEYKEVANGIFARMREINELLEAAKKSKARSADGLQGVGNIKVKRLDAKRKTVTIELD
ncbi:MAG: NFACT family protein [Candidatus Micrarchaeota archaeon]|nr:NFACT family protein [Candidatus Micrarchaeota archaeon]